MCPQDCWAGLLSGISCFWQATIGRWAILLPWISGFAIMSGRKISIEYQDLQSGIILSIWEWLHGVCRPEWAVSSQPGVNRDCPPLRGVPLWCRHFDASQMLIFNGVGLQIQHNLMPLPWALLCVIRIPRALPRANRWLPRSGRTNPRNAVLMGRSVWAGVS